MKIVTAAEMREIDRATTERYGMPSLTLMENAGGAVAEFVIAHYPNATRVAVLCGKGNNGGDGFVVARKLREAGKDVRVLLLADPAELKGDAAEMFKRMEQPSAAARNEAQVAEWIATQSAECPLAIDAILGTGFKPPLATLYASAIQGLNRFPDVVAVDIPSGLDADAMSPVDRKLLPHASAVVTFTAPRPAHIFGGVTEGPVVVAQIGSPAEAIQSNLNLRVIVPQDFAEIIQDREVESNKGTYGHVLVLGGSTGKAGAAAMVGMAALRAGAGLATVGTPKSVLPTVAGFHPEVMTEPMEETEIGSISMRALSYKHTDALVKDKDVLAVGPGISRHKETADFVRSVLKKFDLPTVLDADGLNAFEGQTEKLKVKSRTLVLTPHPGEMARLTGLTVPQVQADRIGVARKFAAEHGVILVLKGHRTLIAEPGGLIWVNTTGNPGMATGGTGDVLTGMISGLIAQNVSDPIRAVLTAVYLHGLAGDVGCESMGEHSLIATDLIKFLPEAFRRARNAAFSGPIEIGQ